MMRAVLSGIFLFFIWSLQVSDRSTTSVEAAAAATAAAFTTKSQNVSGVLLSDVPAFSRPMFLGEYMDETGFYQALKLSNTEPIIRKQSAYQMIEVFESRHYGKILVLDGVLQLTERDADAYNEMLAHIPLFRHPNPKRVLVIGGGDGYVVSEVLKHESVEHVDHVDLDGDVIEVCRKHFSWGKRAWEDNKGRVSLHLADGAQFVADALDDYYDVIIQDSSDPWTWDKNGDRVQLPSSVLYSNSHLMNLHRILSPNGVLSLQAESLQIPSDLEDIVHWRQAVMDVGFLEARYGSIMISSYPTGQIGLLMCEKGRPKKGHYQQVKERFQTMYESGAITTYYQPKLQSSAFDLPLWAERAIYGPQRNIAPVCPGVEGFSLA